MNIPNHVALIPDGNRRWAKQQGLASFMGHQKGAENFEKLVFKALELKISHLTLWGTSLDNITKRSESEVNYLYGIFRDQFNRLANDERVHKEKVKVNIIGRWEEYFSDEAKEAMRKAVEMTKDYTEHNLTFLMAYNGDDEMIDCIKKIKISDAEVTGESIKANLWTKGLPPVDFVIRTGCEKDPHLSAGFMMWDTAYSQLYFTEKFFPDFSPVFLEEAIKDYSERERRNGK